MSTSDTPVSRTSDPPKVAVFSMKQAAQVAGISVSTLRRRRADLEAAGAIISPDGWQVPITALEALGFMRSSISAHPVPLTSPASKESLDSDALHEAQKRIRELESENVELRHRAEMAEAIARERAEALNAERMALRMIVASPSSSSNSEQAKEGSSSSSAPQASVDSEGRTSWWKRTFG